MKTSLLLLLSFLAVPLHAEIRAAVRGGLFQGMHANGVGTVELEARYHGWSVVPAYEVIVAGHDTNAAHIDLRRYFRVANHTLWIGAGPTSVRASAEGQSESTWNADVGFEFRTTSAWKPFIAARYYSFRIPIFRDVLEANGAVISIGVSRRLF